jgi:hypothetical protein
MNNENLKPVEKGQVLNPNGRPKGSKNRATILKKWAGVKIKIKNPEDENEEIEVTALDEIVLAQIAKARTGDTQAFKEIMDGIFGKNKDEVDLFLDGDIKVSNVIDMSKWK